MCVNVRQRAALCVGEIVLLRLFTNPWTLDPVSCNHVNWEGMQPGSTLYAEFCDVFHIIASEIREEGRKSARPEPS